MKATATRGYFEGETARLWAIVRGLDVPAPRVTTSPRWRCRRCDRHLTDADLVPMILKRGEVTDKHWVHLVQPQGATGPRTCGLLERLKENKS